MADCDTFKKNAQHQRRIEKVVDIVIKHQNGVVGEERVRSQIEALYKAQDVSVEVATIQAARYYEAVEIGNERRRGAARIVYSYLHNEARDKKLLSMIVSCLDRAASQSHNVFFEMLDRVVYEGTTAPHLAKLESAMEKASHPDPPVVIVEYMCTASPTKTASILAKLYVQDTKKRREINSLLFPLVENVWKKRHGLTRSQRAIKRCRDAIRSLASDDRWWIRLCAAAFLAEHYDLRPDGLLKKLKEDPDPRVRTTVKDMLN
jgi:ribosomal protein S24E